MLDLSERVLPRPCARCGTELAAAALACPACAALVHRDQLQELADRANASAAAGDLTAARTHWEQALALLPPGSVQHHQIGSRLAELTKAPGHSDVAPAVSHSGRWWRRGIAGLAAAVLLFGGKLKLLMLGLTKISTLFSMFGFIAVYWSIHGWPLAVGIAATIYVHEMGHVAMLRRLGIQAGAPLFIPGVGAVVMLRQHVTDAVTDARIGLAGPVWGFGAAVAAFAAYVATARPIWLAIAELTAFLNLFNLTPIWQLDGARGFHALSRRDRWLIVGVIAVGLFVTGVKILWIVGAAAVYQTLRSEPGPGHPATLATFAGLLLALAWIARHVQ